MHIDFVIKCQDLMMICDITKNILTSNSAEEYFIINSILKP